MSPKCCWGPAKGQHKRGCRPGRPLCRWRRSRPCTCDAMHFPHRKNSGVCRTGLWAVLDQPMRHGRAA